MVTNPADGEGNKGKRKASQKRPREGKPKKGGGGILVRGFLGEELGERGNRRQKKRKIER